LDSIVPASVVTQSPGPVKFTATLKKTIAGITTAVSGEAVTFQVGAQTVGTGTTDSNGVAILSTYNPSSLLAGSYALQALYSGNPGPVPPYNSSISNILNLT